MLDAGRLHDLADYLAAGVESLENAGADFAFIAANTPHLVFDELQRRSVIPLLSIVRATADRAKALGLKKVGLFGTGFTMRASFYPEEFQRAGIALVTPTEPERDFIHKKYIGELLKNQFLPQSREEIMSIAHRMKGRRRNRSPRPGGDRTSAAAARRCRSGHRVSRHDRDSRRGRGR